MEPNGNAGQWPKAPVSIRAVPTKLGMLYFNLGDKEASISFDWRADLPEFGTKLWTVDGPVEETFDQSLFGGLGGVRVSAKIAPSSAAFVMRKKDYEAI